MACEDEIFFLRFSWPWAEMSGDWEELQQISAAFRKCTGLRKIEIGVKMKTMQTEIARRDLSIFFSLVRISKKLLANKMYFLLPNECVTRSRCWIYVLISVVHRKVWSLSLRCFEILCHLRCSIQRDCFFSAFWLLQARFSDGSKWCDGDLRNEIYWIIDCCEIKWLISLWCNERFTPNFVFESQQFHPQLIQQMQNRCKFPLGTLSWEVTFYAFTSQ